MKVNLHAHLLPTIVLVCITLAITAAISLTHAATKPVIENLNQKTADAARAEVLPEASGFTEVSQADATPNIVSFHTADNGAGVVIIAADKGFGGAIDVMTGIGPDGKITGVKILNHAETPGLGTKAMTSEYLAQYIDAEKIQMGTLNADMPDATKIDAITGATITSEAVCRAVDRALEVNKAGR
jgi:electron transport complex protein RnfG